MISLVELKQIGRPVNSGICEAAYLDLPKLEALPLIDANEVFFYGWVASNEFGEDIQIRIFDGKHKTYHQINNYRKDVVSALPDYSGSSLCGFAIRYSPLADVSEITLSISVGSTEFPWYWARFERHDAHLETSDSKLTP